MISEPSPVHSFFSLTLQSPAKMKGVFLAGIIASLLSDSHGARLPLPPVKRAPTSGAAFSMQRFSGVPHSSKAQSQAEGSTLGTDQSNLVVSGSLFDAREIEADSVAKYLVNITLGGQRE